MTNLIGISAHMGGGKDLTGSIIQYLTSGSKEAFETWNLCHLKSDERWQIVKFADKLKECAAIILGIQRSSCEDSNAKNSFLSEDWDTLRFKAGNGEYFHFGTKADIVTHNKFGYDTSSLTLRRFLQLFGTEVGRSIHENFWINALFSEYKPIDRRTQQDPDDSNISYPSWIITDCRFENEAEAILSRGGIMIRLQRNSNVPSDHTSETALDNYTKFDYVIDNRETTIDQLIKMVKDILIIENIITKD